MIILPVGQVIGYRMPRKKCPIPGVPRIVDQGRMKRLDTGRLKASRGRGGKRLCFAIFARFSLDTGEASNPSRPRKIRSFRCSQSVEMDIAQGGLDLGYHQKRGVGSWGIGFSFQTPIPRSNVLMSKSYTCSHNHI